MTQLMFLLLMQFVISTKAGLVNHIQGVTNVKLMDQVPAGAPIRTALDGYVEILLTPGSFLRLDENSEAVLDDVNIAHVAVRIVKGSAVIEIVEIDKDYPVRVTTGNLKIELAETGLYRFADGVATVLQGKLRTGDSKFTYEKGWQVFYRDNYRAKKSGPLQPTGLDIFSQTRSERIAYANYNVADSLRSTPALPDYRYWLFYPGFGAYTFIPHSNRTSPYGYRYFEIGGYPAGGGSWSGSGTSSSGGSSGSSNSNPGSSNTGGASSGGGGFAVSTPSGERASPGTYIGGKNSPAPATVP